MKRLLLAVTGMSPQVVTETLYAIHQRGEAWPDRICLITTARGKSLVCQRLKNEGWLNRLAHDLARPALPFSEQDVLVPAGADGQTLDDARTEADHEAMADFITQTVREFTSDEDLTIHASIAGGRKTMTFYLGYAMSLFGRHHDRLSHVLVSEGYENSPDFFYPRPGDNRESTIITLADIPFVRQRNQLPRFLMENLGGSLSYRQLMNLINLGDTPDRIRLTLSTSDKRLTVRDRQSSGEMDFNATIQFPNLVLWGFYLLLVEATLEADDSYTRPTNPTEADLLARMLLRKIHELVGLETRAGQSSAELASQLLNDDRNLKYLEPELVPPKMIEPFMTREKGLDRQTFSNYCNRIGTLLNRYLPANLVGYVQPRPGQQEERDNGHTKGAGYLLRLPDPSLQIEIRP